MATQPTQLTGPQVCRLFGISNMTLWNWRQGTTRMTPLPTATPRKATEGKNHLRFNVKGVLAWAKKHHIELVATVEQVAEVKQGKPGPKARQVVPE